MRKAGRRSGFTLIELLVVIAIIAVLAAILFPVFASAKLAAKKTAALSNFKSCALGTLMYASDHDDGLPQSFSWDEENDSPRFGFWVPVPAGWQRDGIHDVEPRKSQDSMFWANAVLPYTKSTGVYEMPGVSNLKFSVVDYGAANALPATVGVGFNGMLHAYNLGAIASPTDLPLLWPATYRRNVVGFGFTNPALACYGSGPCRFNPSGPPQAGGPDDYGYSYFTLDDEPGTYNLFVYTGGFHFGATDGHAKFVMMGAPKWPKISSNVNKLPFSSMDPSAGDGVPYWMTDCVSPGAEQYTAPFYPGWFRPDSQFNYTDKECDFGQSSGGEF